MFQFHQQIGCYRAWRFRRIMREGIRTESLPLLRRSRNFKEKILGQGSGSSKSKHYESEESGRQQRHFESLSGTKQSGNESFFKQFYNNHLNIGQVWYLNGSNVSSWQRVRFSLEVQTLEVFSKKTLEASDFGGPDIGGLQLKNN